MDFVELGKSPVSPESPSGTEVRETDLFLELQSEVNRTQSMSSSAVIDWKKVGTLSADILSSLGKDVLVAAYLSVALSRTQGPPGVLTGLLVLNDLLQEHWETCYPPLKRIRARRNAISWWVEQMQAVLPELTGPSMSPEHLSRAIGVLRDLNGFLGDKDPEGPMLVPLYSLVQGLPVTEPEPEAPKTASPSPAETTSSVPAKGSAEIFSLSDDDPEETLDHLFDLFKRVGTVLGERSFPDPRAYRYPRMAVWESIREYPDAQDRITRIPPPPPHLLETLETLRTNGLPEARIRFAELHQPDFPFWFDLSCESGQAMDLLGSEWELAKEAVRTELRFLGFRLPGLTDLSFSDGTPFLSDTGRQWLGSSTPGEPSEGGEGGRSHRDPIGPVRTLVGDRDLEKAVQSLEVLRRQSPTVHMRFQIDLEFLSLVRDMGRDLPVLSLAQSLLADLDRYQLDGWDPPLAARALAQIHRALFDSDDPEDRKMADSALRRLLKIDLPGGVEVFRNRR
ncbi:MAG: type VI secretion system protein TssA [Nitrospirota bacterium]|nr:type VI secretion system protein TssA [Nitrospirota bacterium]